MGDSLTGELVTSDAQHFAVSGSLINGGGSINVALPVVGECDSVAFSIQQVERDHDGGAVAFSGFAIGRCCGTIDETFRYARSA
jgi:hypothetical protein